MDYKVGIIICAGKAERFGGVLKELLPVNGNKSFLRHAYDRMPPDCGNVIVVSNRDKIQAHVKDLGTLQNVVYMIQEKPRGIWDAMVMTMQIKADYYYFTMPDTYLPEDVFIRMPEKDFMLGVFHTIRPERFGVLRGDEIVNKKYGEPGMAWGTLSWSRMVRDRWMLSTIAGYTEAINMAMREFGFQLVPLEYYHDLSCFEDYVNYVGGPK